MARVSRLLGGPSRRGGSRAVAFAALALAFCAIGGALADGEDDAIDSVDPDDESFPTSEDVPLWQFETEVVTIGKASGKEKRKDVPAFFLRGDDPAQAATRFVYLNTLPMNHLPHFASVFAHEWRHKVPEELKPRTRAHKRRAAVLGPRSYWKRGAEHAREGRDGEAHFDYARAVAGVGLAEIDDPTAKAEETLSNGEMDEIYNLLNAHHRRHSRALNAADKTREQRAAAHERNAWVFERRKEARRRVEEDEADFRVALGVQSRDDTSEAPHSADDTTNDAEHDAGNDETLPRVAVVAGLAVSLLESDDAASAAAAHFAKIGSSDAKLACSVALELHSKLDRPTGACSPAVNASEEFETSSTTAHRGDDSRTPEACGNAAKKALHGSEDDGSISSTLLLRAFILAGGAVDDRAFFDDLTKALVAAHAYASMRAAVEAEDWETVVEEGRRGDAAVAGLKKPPDARRKLAAARAHSELGNWRECERAANAAVAASVTRGDWRRGQVRALAVSYGARCAIARGDGDAALRSFAVAMRADPDNALFKNAYKLIKDAGKLVADAGVKLDRGESRLALESADKASANLRAVGADEKSAMFAEIDARRCVAHAQMRAFESALEHCARAAKAIGCYDDGSHDSEEEFKRSCDRADARVYARVMMSRAEVHLRDDYAEGAVGDLRDAVERISPNAERGSSEAARILEEARGRLHEAERAKHKHDNDRDHAKMLDLPENLAELSKDRRCDFVKKAYKKAALKWHPDKAAESGKLRAARKMNEMTEARDHVNERLGCVAPKKPDENDPRQQQRQHPHFRNFHGGFPGGGGFGGGGHQQRQRQYQRRPGGQRMHWEF
uniref:J domain-containing protein n=1 Tax=Micromonas pusilla TaxID=38833 RepID=A0A7S0KBY9_MICPS|mmetsp:Transcript_10602/g.41425  ORF Transcript_10602/g.41425 Transcript_10602/m.41425 type:complete len:845 (+) Transcript_10602:38-2572(+)